VIGSLKAMVVVLVIGFAVFWIAKPIALRFMAEQDYQRRCKVWLALTAVAFAAPNFWLFFVVAFPTLFLVGKRDKNPLALALFLMHVIPPVWVSVPSLGVRMVDMNSLRLLTLAILVPAMFNTLSPRPAGSPAFKLAAACMLGYNLLMLALYMPYEAPTNTVRRLIDYSLDSGIVFFAFYRLLPTPRVTREALMCFCLGTAVVACIGVFEWLRNWLLYVTLTDYWGVADSMAFLTRGGALRAQAATGHSMTLGFITAMAFALWLGFARSIPDTKRKWLATAVLLAGCYVSLSRAGWMMVAVAYVMYLLIGPMRPAAVFKQLGLIAIAAAVLVFAPGGEKFINLLPFVGNTDTHNIDYRERLADMSWMLIWRNPWFGDPFVMRYMEALRQGQGIIDLVNVYASIALFAGFVGLTLFIVPNLIAMWSLLRAVLGSHRNDLGLHMLCAALAAGMVANLLMFAVGSLGATLTFMFWGLSAAALRIAGFRPERQGSPELSSAQPGISARTPRNVWGRHAPN
jgi:hypothetical protein